MTPQGLDMLDVMIARAEAACERGRKRLEADRGPAGLMHAPNNGDGGHLGPTAGADESGGGDPTDLVESGSSNEESGMDGDRWRSGRGGYRPSQFNVVGASGDL